MGINQYQRAQRDAARHKKTEAVASFVEHQKDEPICLHQDGNKTLWRSGVVTRNDKNVGHEAMQRARELINSVPDVNLSRPKTLTGTNDEWFKNNQQSVEQQIGERISVHKNPQVQRDEMPVFEEIPIEHYRPQVDDDAPDYIPKSERYETSRATADTTKNESSRSILRYRRFLVRS